jgi:hypothetical protein
MSCCEDCGKKEYRVIRYKSPSLAISREPIFFGKLPSQSKSVVVDFKARAQRQGGRNRIEYKSGLTGSGSRFLQGIQSVASMAVPGNPSVLRSPVRSRAYSAITPGGIPGARGVSPGGSDRGYRCPEGYQYGGRFTDSRFSTCGQKLFDVAGRIGESIQQIVQATQTAVSGQPLEARRVGFQGPSGNVVTSRAAQIPKVSSENKKVYFSNSEKIISEMVSFDEPVRRMVRRDGFALEPVVSAAVLRTVPDNRDMDGANYISFIDKASQIGTSDDIGLLSNTGIRKLTYVIPGGSTISLEKTRTLTVGERRKLGRTIRTLDSVSTESDPSSRMKQLAAEMGSGIAYTESFSMENPNEIVEAVLPGTRTIRRVRRWYFESMLKSPKGSKKNRAEKDSVKTNIKPIDEKIKNLQNAIKHLNSNGSIDKISPSIRAEAIKRSKIYKQRIMKNGLLAFDKPDGQTLIEIPASSSNYEHIGASIVSEIQSFLDLVTPDVSVAGAPGTRRPYFIQETLDTLNRAKIDRDSSTATFNSDDLLRISVSDFITDTRDRDLSTIVSITAASQKRAISSINKNSALSGSVSFKSREKLKLEDFYSDEYLNAIRSNFEKRSKAQRLISIKLFDAMLARLKEYDIAEMAARLSIDGEYTNAEKSHIKLVQSLITLRIEKLSNSRSAFLKLLGLSQ